MFAGSTSTRASSRVPSTPKQIHDERTANIIYANFECTPVGAEVIPYDQLEFFVYHKRSFQSFICDCLDRLGYNVLYGSRDEVRLLPKPTVASMTCANCRWLAHVSQAASPRLIYLILLLRTAQQQQKQRKKAF